MKTRPKRLLLLALFLVATAASFPVQVMFLYGHTIFELEAIVAKLAPLNWMIMLLAPLTAYLTYRASPWLMGAIPALLVLVFYNNWFVGQMGLNYSPMSASVASGFFLFIVAAMINREGLRMILNPQSRWWMTPARKRMALPVRLKLVSSNFAKKSQEAFNEFYIKTYDVSECGAFIPLDQPEVGTTGAGGKNPYMYGAVFQSLAVGTQCYICLPLKDVNFIQCRAEIVRNTKGRGDYPAGVGLRFLGLSWAERRKLNHFLQHAA